MGVVFLQHHNLDNTVLYRIITHKKQNLHSETEDIL